MKILLFGEFSGLHTNLKYGLEQLGHSVTLVSNGDGVKQIGGADVFLRGVSRYKLIAALTLRIKCLWSLVQFRGYDVVQYIVPFWLPFPKCLQLLYLRFLKRYNKRVYYNACGGDSYVTLNMATLRYSSLSDAILEDDYQRMCDRLSPRNIQYSLQACALFDGIIASSFTYHHSSSRLSNYFGYIPFPAVPIPAPTPFPSTEGPIKIFFGYTRTVGKGVRYILKALELIEKEFGNRVSVQIVQRVPYADYVKLFDHCHIFIDQSSDYGYGMNALLGMVKGKVVLSGCEPEMQALLDRPCPIVNITPDVEDIQNKVRRLLKNPHTLPAIGLASYEFVKEVHEPVKIASLYLEKWSKKGGI